MNKVMHSHTPNERIGVLQAFLGIIFIVPRVSITEVQGVFAADNIMQILTWHIPGPKFSKP